LNRDSKAGVSINASGYHLRCGGSFDPYRGSTVDAFFAGGDGGQIVMDRHTFDRVAGTLSELPTPATGTRLPLRAQLNRNDVSLAQPQT
jgi:hypothetical protein